MGNRPRLMPSIKEMKAETSSKALTREEVEELKTRLLAEELEGEVRQHEAERAAAEPKRPTVITIPGAASPEEIARRREAEKAKAMSQIEQIENYLLAHYELRRNTVSETIEYRLTDGADSAFRELQDEDENDLIYQLKRQGFKKPQDDLQTLLRSSMVPKIDPVRQYFDNLQLRQPGAVDRLADCIILDSSIMMNIGGRNYQQLFRHYFRRWLTACYLCSTGLQRNDVMLILIGAQGRFKTSFLNHLCPESMQQYLHSGNINPSLTDYNTATYLIERMFINVDDQMENIFGKDYNAMKSVITADFVSRRTLYTKRAKNRRRIANFCGSVNESHFLRDSNNRRYLCFKIEDIRPEYRDIDMDEVWAEVKLQADHDGTRYVFTKEDFATIDRMNENFLAPTEEDEALRATFAPAQPTEPDIYLLQFSEILRLLKLLTGNNQLRQYNLQTALRKYGFESHMQRCQTRSYPCNLIAVRTVCTGVELQMVLTQIERFHENLQPAAADAPSISIPMGEDEEPF